LACYNKGVVILPRQYPCIIKKELLQNSLVLDLLQIDSRLALHIPTPTPILAHKGVANHARPFLLHEEKNRLEKNLSKLFEWLYV
jgi:hypothetical protein